MERRNWRARAGGRLAAALAAMALGGCATALSGVDVTRFHNDAVARSGTISIVAREAGDPSSLAFRPSANAVSAALTRVGYQVLDRGAPGAAFEAVVDVRSQIVQPTAERRSPVSVGVGGSTGSFGSGLGVGVGINLSGRPKPMVVTQLRVQIRRTGDGTAIWEGRAETAAKQGSPAAQPGMAAGKLADALFKDFPGVSGATVHVP